jgi:predicted transcriptional regulator
MKFKLIKNCNTCKFNFNGFCCGDSDYYEDEEEIKKIIHNCKQWEIGFDHYKDLVNSAPWYVVDEYKWHNISFKEFMELAEKEYSNKKIDINIYDAIEKIYKMSHYKIANILGVTIGVINYAHIRGTPKKRIDHFSNTLCIPKEFFYKFTNKDIPKLEECYKEYLCKTNKKECLEKLNSTTL